jgi:hypothetical protein
MAFGLFTTPVRHCPSTVSVVCLLDSIKTSLLSRHFRTQTPRSFSRPNTSPFFNFFFSDFGWIPSGLFVKFLRSGFSCQEIRCDQLKNKSSRRVTYGNPCYGIGSKANSIYFLNDRSVYVSVLSLYSNYHQQLYVLNSKDLSTN